jgi:hypothetical protein
MVTQIKICHVIYVLKVRFKTSVCLGHTFFHDMAQS